MKTLGQTIRFYRKVAGLKAVELGKAVGTSQSRISLIENDKRVPDLVMLKNIYDTLNITDFEFANLLPLMNIEDQVAYHATSDFEIEIVPGYLTKFSLATHYNKQNNAETPYGSSEMNRAIYRTLKPFLESEQARLMAEVQQTLANFEDQLAIVLEQIQQSTETGGTVPPAGPATEEEQPSRT